MRLFVVLKRKVQSPEEAHKDFSEQLLQNLSKFLYTLLLTAAEGDSNWKVKIKNESDLYVRLETLLWGGDEFMLVVPAWKGWQVLTHFLTEMQAQDWQFENNTLTYAASIVFCHSNSPIHRVKELAKQLVDDVVKKGSPLVNAFAYEVLESFDHLGQKVSEYRLKRLRHVYELSKHTPDPLVIEPFENLQGSLFQVAEAMGIIKTLMPKRQLYRIAQGISLGKNMESEVDLLWKDIDKELDQDHRRNLEDFFGSPQEKFFWLHLFELWDYIDAEDANPLGGEA